MGKNKNDLSNLIAKIIAFLVLLLTCNSFSNISSVSAQPKEEALNTVVNFLNAQKECNVDDMIAYSDYVKDISNLKEFYTRMCKEQPLQKAEITNISIVNKSTVLASIESTYKDRMFISTSPVIKKDGQWKIIKGIPSSGYVELPANSTRDKKEKEVEKAVKDYSTALKSGNITEMKKYIKVLPLTDKDKLEEHLKALSEGPIPEVTTFGIEVITDTFATAQIETKHEHFCFVQNYAVCKEDGQWQVVFGHPLTNSAIPRSDQPVEIK